MSEIGKNIKKIRTYKKLSQSQFADIFELSRGTVGAYEEGRAEPKIETIIQIANHFGLSIDLLLNKELTTNDLYRFNLLNQKLDEAHHFTKPVQRSYAKEGIPLVKIDDQLEYMVHLNNRDFISKLPSISLPVAIRGTARAFELSGSEMEYNQNGLHHGDILLCQQTPMDKVRVGEIYVIVHPGGLVTRRLKAIGKQNLILHSDDPNYPEISILIKEIQEVWNVRGAYSTYLNPPKLVENRVMTLEKRLEEIEKMLNPDR